MAIPNPNPNIADGVKCDNKTYSSNKIESLISTATELPIPESGDAGKVLTVNSDADGYELDVIPDELPTPAAGDAGKVLTVNSDSDGYELANVPAELPTPESGDAGKVLTVNSDSDGYELATSFKPVITEITPVTDTTTTATDFVAYTDTFDKGIYIFNGQTLWKTTGTANGLTMILVVGSDTVNQNLEYTDGWCVENLTSVFAVASDNTTVTVKLYQSTGSSVDIEFKGNFTKIG